MRPPCRPRANCSGTLFLAFRASLRIDVADLPHRRCFYEHSAESRGFYINVAVPRWGTVIRFPRGPMQSWVRTRAVAPAASLNSPLGADIDIPGTITQNRANARGRKCRHERSPRGVVIDILCGPTQSWANARGRFSIHVGFFLGPRYLHSVRTHE